MNVRQTIRASLFVLAAMGASVAVALPPFDPNDPRPPEEKEKHCVFDTVECVREFHVFTGVLDVFARCMRTPCRIHYVKAGEPRAAYSQELRENDTVYLSNLELFVWDGAGYGSVDMIRVGTYIILNRDIDPVVPRCRF